MAGAQGDERHRRNDEAGAHGRLPFGVFLAGRFLAARWTPLFVPALFVAAFFDDLVDFVLAVFFVVDFLDFARLSLDLAVFAEFVRAFFLRDVLALALRATGTIVRIIS
jgi:hypothetical protein